MCLPIYLLAFSVSVHSERFYFFNKKNEQCWCDLFLFSVDNLIVFVADCKPSAEVL